jgi:hypothetical protein
MSWSDPWFGLVGLCLVWVNGVMRRYFGSRYTDGSSNGSGVIQYPYIDGHDIIGVFWIPRHLVLGPQGGNRCLNFGSISFGVGFTEFMEKND